MRALHGVGLQRIYLQHTIVTPHVHEELAQDEGCLSVVVHQCLASIVKGQRYMHKLQMPATCPFFLPCQGRAATPQGVSVRSHKHAPQAQSYKRLDFCDLRRREKYKMSDSAYLFRWHSTKLVSTSTIQEVRGSSWSCEAR